MPLTAIHPDLGLVDVTRPGLGVGLEWAAVHRVTPRVALECPACAGAVVAKESRLGNPFFAHYRRSPDCWLTGETVAHRLLKVALAAAVRDAGWYADLEVAGHGETPWRADVLARRPDDGRRVAFEAQLAAIDVDEIGRRTDNYAAAGVEVCWVSDKMKAAWLGRAPYLVVRPGDNEYTVEAGVWRFDPQYCEDRSRCAWNLFETSQIYAAVHRGSGPRPCPGHGQWSVVRLPLAEVVRFIVDDRVRVVAVNEHLSVGTVYGIGVRERHHVWTAAHYVRLFEKQLVTKAENERVEAAAEDAAARHQKNVEALVARQTALKWPACTALGTRNGQSATVRPGQPAWDEYWGRGIPVVSLNDSREVFGVICPVASRITPQIAARLARVVIVVATEQERARIAQHCWHRQEFLVLPVDQSE